MKLSIFTASWLLLLSTHTFAAVTTLKDNASIMELEVTEEYVLGDNDTLTSAKGVIIEQVKVAASDYAGNYVESVLVVEDNNVTKEQVKVLSAGFIEVLDSSFKRSINNSGSVVLSATAKVKLSKESIRDGLAKLKGDSVRKKQINELQQKNEQLQRELIELTKKINSSSTTRADLMKSREDVLSKLNTNRKIAKQVFDRGTLFQLAMLDDSEYELAKKDIDENVFGYFVHNTKITLSKPQFEKNKQGNYNIIMDVSWNLPKSPARAVLNKYLTLVKDGRKHHIFSEPIPYGVVFSKYANTKEKGKHKYTEQIRDYVLSKRVVIIVDAQYANNIQPLSNLVGGNSKSDYAFQFSDDSKGRVDVSEYEKLSKMVIYNIKPSEIEKITEITAKVEVISSRDFRGYENANRKNRHEL